MRKLIILAVSALLAGAMFSATAGAEIRIGVAGPMTGQYAAFGKQIRRGAEMAVEEINAAGGINGEKVRVLIGDDGCDPVRAITTANEMAAQKVVFVVGHFCGGASVQASRVYARAKIIQIVPAATNPALTEKRPGPGIFRIVPNDRKQGAFAGAYIAAKFTGKRTAILKDGTYYGTILAESV